MLNNSAPSYLYGGLPDAYFDCAPFSNVTALLWDPTLQALLRICGYDDRQIGTKASAYDRFRAYCNAREMLEGHPVLQKNDLLLRTCFGIDLPCNAQTCDTIWHLVAEPLLTDPMSKRELLQTLTQGLPALLPIHHKRLLEEYTIPEKVLPVLDANSLLDTAATDWHTWEGEIHCALDRLSALNGFVVAIQLQTEGEMPTLSLYAVEQALKAKNKTPEQKQLLSMQLLRQISIKCQEKDMTLFAELASIRSTDPFALLRHLYKHVGLPKTVCFFKDTAKIDALIELDATFSQSRLRYGLQTAFYPTERELLYAYETTVARYPKGALWTLLGTDLRYSAFEKKRLERVIGIL